ncbi:universal stress protein [Halostella sp. PRR32]|uniref:universal stress protein n=1 Tax=Halostella sp. PRR32 TaxID=3098147 RepID=UPI002B1DBB50|nr:universal stress protein [Halostella sp. PRR32]
MPGSDWNVLVPIEVLEGESVPETVIELLSTLPVVLLGYHVLPEQTPPGQARMQFEDQAQAKLDDLVAAFDAADGTAETRLVFTHDEDQTIERVADETGCEAILHPNPSSRIERLLLPVGTDADLDQIAGFVASVVGDRDIELTLYYVAETDADVPSGEAVVEEATGLLRERGVAADAITGDVTVSGAPVRAIATAAADHDAVVMGESEPSLGSVLFGDPSEQVADRSLGPVIVVRNERDADASAPAE